MELKMQNAWHRAMLDTQRFPAPSPHVALVPVAKIADQAPFQAGGGREKRGLYVLWATPPLLWPLGGKGTFAGDKDGGDVPPTALGEPHRPAEPQAGLTGRAQGHVGRGHVGGRLEGLDLSGRLAGRAGAHDVHLAHAEAGVGGGDEQDGEGRPPGPKPVLVWAAPASCRPRYL